MLHFFKTSTDQHYSINEIKCCILKAKLCECCPHWMQTFYVGTKMPIGTTWKVDFARRFSVSDCFSAGIHIIFLLHKFNRLILFIFCLDSNSCPECLTFDTNGKKKKKCPLRLFISLYFRLSHKRKREIKLTKRKNAESIINGGEK